MAPGVISDCVPLGDHAPDKFRVSLAVVVGHEEHRADVLLFQRIENISGAAVLVARVKCQVDGLSARVTDVKRVVLPQLLGGDIADRRLSLGLER